jgi:Zn finger protein HypA/HybF involved in hydrogenase expression
MCPWFDLHWKFGEGFMHKLCVYAGVLFFLAFSLAAYPQEQTQTGEVSEQAQSDSPAASPDLPDEVTLESSFGNVVLPHDVHVKKVKLKCPVCHHQIHAAELDTPHPDYLESSRANCQTCHDTSSEKRKKYYKCSDCHHSETDDIADETLSSKVVIHKSCWKCHETGTGAEASAGCGNCHAKANN